MSVGLRQLRYFLAVAEELHFGRAAERAGVAQPALSQQIRGLERALGVKLFARSTRSVELTEAGAALVRHARVALAEVEEGAEAARRAARGERGHLRVGFVESAAIAVVPAAVRRFRARHPEVRLTLRELGVGPQLEGLASGVLDVGFVRPPIEAEGLRLRTVVEEPFVAAVASGHPLAGRRRIAVEALAREPLIVLSRDVVPGLYDQAVALQQGHAQAAHLAQEATSFQAVLGLVAAGLGVSILPDSVRGLGRAGVAFIGLAGSPTTTILAAAREDDASPLTAGFERAATGERAGRRARRSTDRTP
jgi:DNA-binding transcriptional LysR family regulator